MRTGVLGQVAIAEADAEEDLYDVPASLWAGVSTILVCNRNAAAKTFSLRVRPGFETEAADKQYIFKDVEVPGNDTYEITCGLVLGPLHLLRITASTTEISVTVFGWERPV